MPTLQNSALMLLLLGAFPGALQKLMLPSSCSPVIAKPPPLIPKDKVQLFHWGLSTLSTQNPRGLSSPHCTVTRNPKAGNPKRRTKAGPCSLSPWVSQSNFHKQPVDLTDVQHPEQCLSHSKCLRISVEHTNDPNNYICISQTSCSTHMHLVHNEIWLMLSMLMPKHVND